MDRSGQQRRKGRFKVPSKRVIAAMFVALSAGVIGALPAASEFAESGSLGNWAWVLLSLAVALGVVAAGVSASEASAGDVIEIDPRELEDYKKAVQGAIEALLRRVFEALELRDCHVVALYHYHQDDDRYPLLEAYSSVRANRPKVATDERGDPKILVASGARRPTWFDFLDDHQSTANWAGVAVKRGDETMGMITLQTFDSREPIDVRSVRRIVAQNPPELQLLGEFLGLIPAPELDKIEEAGF